MFSGAELSPKGLKEHLPLGHNKHEEGQKTLLWLKQRLLLASAIYAPHKSFCSSGGQKHIFIFMFPLGVHIFRGGHLCLI